MRVAVYFITIALVKGPSWSNRHEESVSGNGPVFGIAVGGCTHAICGFACDAISPGLPPNLVAHVEEYLAVEAAG